jgi:hypothetical protein
MAKAEIGTKTKNRGNISSTTSSTEKIRGMSPRIAQTLKKRKRGSKVEQNFSLRLNKHHGR